MRRLAALLTLLVVGACGSGAGGSRPPGPADPATTKTAAASAPELAVATLMRSLDEGDCAAVRRVVVTPADIDCDVVRSAADSFAAEGIDLDEVVYAAGPVRATSSTVTITWGNDYPDETYDVERVDGDWRVVFDSVA